MHLPFEEKMHIQEGAAGLLLQGEWTSVVTRDNPK
jgi:hypothetical protein